LRKVIPPYAIAQLSHGSRAEVLEPAQLAVSKARLATIISERDRMRCLCTLRHHAGLAECIELRTSLSCGCALALARSREAHLLIRDVRGYPGLAAACGSPIGSPEQTPLLELCDECTDVVRPTATGTLIEEPARPPVDALTRPLHAGVFAALAELQRRGSGCHDHHQDGLGTPSFPRRAFEESHKFILAAFESQGIAFDAVFICPSLSRRRLRLPQTQNRARKTICGMRMLTSPHAVIGDRETDPGLRSQPRRAGLRVLRNGSDAETWRHR